MVKNIEKKHNQRCSECKNRIIELLRKLFKDVKVDHDFLVGIPSLKDQGQHYYSGLKNIREALESHRGHRNFVRIKKIPRCDLYVTEPGFVVELDESQHFSTARGISLSHYPPDFNFGFNTREWINLCGKIKSVDNDPPYRDEQRAWYDTLRDFLPFMVGLHPTVRIYMGKFRWCSLDPQKESDVATFLNLVPGLTNSQVEKHVVMEMAGRQEFYGPKWYVAQVEQGKSEDSGEGLPRKNASYLGSSDSVAMRDVPTISEVESHPHTSTTKPMGSDLSGKEGLYGPKWWRDAKNQHAKERPTEADRATLENVVVSDGSKGKCNIQESPNSFSNPINPLTESSAEPGPSKKEGLYGPNWYSSTMEHGKCGASGETKRSDETSLVEPADHAAMSNSLAISGTETQLPNSTETTRGQSEMPGTGAFYGPKWYRDDGQQLEKAPPREMGRLMETNNVMASNSSLLLATVVIESYAMATGEQRMELLEAVLNRFCKIVDVTLFPAGFFRTDSSFNDIKDVLVDPVCSVLKQCGSQSIVCLGVDARDSVDQIAMAITKDGTIALGKKFFPTKDEDGYIDLADDPHAGELSHPRTFTVKGKEAYLAMCYDSFGIRKNHVRKRNADLILNLVHGFYPHGEGNSGDVYFAKHGFAGSSKEWRCPTYAAAVFFDRKVPLNWPTGVLWNQGSASTQKWRYQYNAIVQPPWEIVKIPDVPEAAYIRVFSI
jgi:hypothetical protein